MYKKILLVVMLGVSELSWSSPTKRVAPTSLVSQAQRRRVSESPIVALPSTPVPISPLPTSQLVNNGDSKQAEVADPFVNLREQLQVVIMQSDGRLRVADESQRAEALARLPEIVGAAELLRPFNGLEGECEVGSEFIKSKILVNGIDNPDKLRSLRMAPLVFDIDSFVTRFNKRFDNLQSSCRPLIEKRQKLDLKPIKEFSDKLILAGIDRELLRLKKRSLKSLEYYWQGVGDLGELANPMLWGCNEQGFTQILVNYKK